jgi:hypothetical protein
MEKKLLKDLLKSKQVKTFDDLVFKKRLHFVGVQDTMEFPNGHKISVVGGVKGLRGDGVNTFEIWRSCDFDIKGYLSKDEVSSEMLELQAMSKDVPIVGYK